MLPGPTDEQVRAAAIEILQRPPYARWQQADDTTAALADLLRWLTTLDAWLFDLALHQPLLYWLLVGSVLLVGGVLLGHIVWSVRAALSAPQPVATQPVVTEGPSLFAQAQGLAAQGQYLEAAQRLQLATIELLLQRGWIDLARSDPNRVLRARVSGAALPVAERDALLGLIDQLETRWFRDRGNDAALYAGWLALHRRMSVLRGGL